MKITLDIKVIKENGNNICHVYRLEDKIIWMSIFPKQLYRVIIISIKISASCLYKMSFFNNMYTEMKRQRILKSVIMQKNKAGEIALSGMKTY